MGELTDQQPRGPRVVYAPMPRKAVRIPLIVVGTVAVFWAVAIIGLAIPLDIMEIVAYSGFFLMAMAAIMFGVLYIIFRCRLDAVDDVDPAPLSPIVRGLHARDHATPYIVRVT